MLGDKEFEVLCGDSETVLKTLPDDSVDMCVTSPPYFSLRSYRAGEKEIGQEDSPIEFVNRLASVFRELRRVLKPCGTLWLNLGDTYNSTWKELPTKNLLGIPWRVAFALQDDGWILRSDIIWHKPNALPNSCTDRCTTAHEYIFMFAKQPQYYFDYEAIEEEATGYDGRKDTLLKGSPKYSQGDYLADGTPNSFSSRGHERWKFKQIPQHKNLMEDEKGQTNHSFHKRRAEGLPDEVYPVRRKRDVWSVPTIGYEGAHFATFPEKLVEPCILAGCPKHGLVMDCFSGAGTTGVVAVKNHRRYIGIELNKEYVELSMKRIAEETAQQTFDF